MYVCGWPPRPALILNPIEHFEITSVDDHFFVSGKSGLRLFWKKKAAGSFCLRLLVLE
jgi:hypothetical protein